MIKGFYFCFFMLCYSLYCFFLVFCILKLWDRELLESINCYKMYNYGSIIKLFLKELKFIIMYSMLEKYIFFIYLFYVLRLIVYLIIFLNLNIFDYRIFLEKLRFWIFCFFCWYEFVLVVRFNGIKLKFYVIMGYFWNINFKIIYKKCK